ncbi:MAG: DNA (cytosine-5-)-methyltransferase, partial [Flavobacteriales bacterium]
MADKKYNKKKLKVAELFAGVGGFRLGFEGLPGKKKNSSFKVIWSNQWEPTTKKQDASLIYQKRFGKSGHITENISDIKTKDIPHHDILVGGFPCQDYSVAATLKNSGGIIGKKGVLWWEIYRILNEKGKNRPSYLILENVDRLLKSPATQRGRDFAVMLASLN